MNTEDLFITEYIDKSQPIKAVLKQQYHDFIVREIYKTQNDITPKICICENLYEDESIRNSFNEQYDQWTKQLESRKEIEKKEKEREKLDDNDENIKIDRSVQNENNKPEKVFTLTGQQEKNFDTAVENAKIKITYIKAGSDSNDAIIDSSINFKEIKNKIAYFINNPSRDELKLLVESKNDSASDIELKEIRTEIHKFFSSLNLGLETRTLVSTGEISVKFSARSIKNKEVYGTTDKNSGFFEKTIKNPPGTYTNFTLTKCGIDTMYAVERLTKYLPCCNRCPSKAFIYNGTKDKRGVTSQRMSVKRVWPGSLRLSIETLHKMQSNELANITKIENNEILNCSNNQMIVSDFTFTQEPECALGNNYGNEFEIVLRELNKESAINLIHRLKTVNNYGFVNYFGMQRFGSATPGTHEIGRLLMQHKYNDALSSIIIADSKLTKSSKYSSAINKYIEDCNNNEQAKNNEDVKTIRLMEYIKNLAKEGIYVPFQTKKIAITFCDMLLKTYSKNRQIYKDEQTKEEYTDDYIRCARGIYSNTINTAIVRNLRTMYTAAFQSYVFNCSASERVRLLNSFDKEYLYIPYEKRFIVGDKIIGEVAKKQNIDINELASEDNLIYTITEKDIEDIKRFYNPNNCLGEEDKEILLQNYLINRATIYDVILPLIGFRTINHIPKNSVGTEIDKLMKKCGFRNAYDVPTTPREYSPRGTYRTVFVKPLSEILCKLTGYNSLNEKIGVSDIDIQYNVQTPIQFEKVSEVVEKEVNIIKKEKIACTVKFQLGSSQYATEMMREILGSCDIYKSDQITTEDDKETNNN